MPINKTNHSPILFNAPILSLPETTATYRLSNETFANPAKINYALPSLQFTPRFQLQINRTNLYISLIDLQYRIEQSIDAKSTIVLEEDEIIWVCFPDPIPYDENCISIITNYFEELLQKNRRKWLPKFKQSFHGLTSHSSNKLTILSTDDSDTFIIGRPKGKFSEVSFPFTSQGYLNLCCYLTVPNKECLLDKIKANSTLYDKYTDIQSRLRYFGIHLHFQPCQCHLIIPNSTSSIFGCQYEFNPSLPKLRTLIMQLTTPRRELWQNLYTSELSNHTKLFSHLTTYFTDISLQLESPNSKRSFAYSPDGYEEFLTYINWIQNSHSI